MIIRTPSILRRAFYVSINTRARLRDEVLAVSIGSAYLGVNRLSDSDIGGFEIVWGILPDSEAL
jgi:hypothetical protein